MAYSEAYIKQQLTNLFTIPPGAQTQVQLTGYWLNQLYNNFLTDYPAFIATLGLTQSAMSDGYYLRAGFGGAIT